MAKIFPNNGKFERSALILKLRQLVTKLGRKLSPNIVSRICDFRSMSIKLRRLLYLKYLRLLLRINFKARQARQQFTTTTTTFAATSLAILVTAFLLALSESDASKASELHLAAAQIIGAALALVLTLSIIPAQRAAELFSITILKLFARDPALMGVFAVLVAATLTSLLLGSGFNTGLSARVSISLQFIILGISFDAIRYFYVATLDLLAPESAIRRLITGSLKQMRAIERLAQQLVDLQVASSGSTKQNDQLIHAWTITNANVPKGIQRLTSQLEEFAHRFIARRDSNATIEMIDAIHTLALEYMRMRSRSVTVHIDEEFLLAGPQSDIADVLNPVYDNIHPIVEDAIAAKNERIVQHAIGRLGQITVQATSIVATGTGDEPIAPLAYGSSFNFDRSVRLLFAARMNDSIITAIKYLRALALRDSNARDVRISVSQANETLFAIAHDSYARSDQYTLFEAIKTMFLAARVDIQLDRFDDRQFDDLLKGVITLVPFEVEADLRGCRRLHTFPAYDLAFEASIPAIVNNMAGKIKISSSRAWLDPFHDLSELMEVVRGHYRKLSEVEFKDVLLRKRVLDSLHAVVRVLFGLVVNPPIGAKGYVQTVLDDLTPQISWFSAFFPEGQRPSRHHVHDVADQLTVLGIDALDKGWDDITARCATTLSDITTNLIRTIDAFSLAEMHVEFEILAKACEAVGKTMLAKRIREMIAYPQNLSLEQQAYYEMARATRFEQFDKSLKKTRYQRNKISTEPVERLYEFLATIKAKKEKK